MKVLFAMSRYPATSLIGNIFIQPNRAGNLIWCHASGLVEDYGCYSEQSFQRGFHSFILQFVAVFNFQASIILIFVH